MSAVDDDSEDGPDMDGVWKDLQGTDEPDAREYLLVQLAEFALDRHDFSDSELGEDIHRYFESLREAREAYHLTAVRVGRCVARMMENNDTLKAMRSHSAEDPNAN